MPLEPLKFDLKVNEIEGPITLKQEYKNTQLHGLTKRFKLQDFQ